jgi:hypothetical protein
MKSTQRICEDSTGCWPITKLTPRPISVDVPSVSAGFTMMFPNRSRSFKNEIDYNASFWQSTSNLSKSLQFPNQTSLYCTKKGFISKWFTANSGQTIVTLVWNWWSNYALSLVLNGSPRCFLLWMDEGFCIVTVAASLVYEVATKRIQ